MSEETWTPPLFRLIRMLPRSWRLSLLRQLAWPEFTVTRSWVVADPTRPGGMRVDQIPLAETAEREREARLAMTLGL